MAKKKRLVPDFYDLRVNQMMDKRIWDLPIVAEDEDILHVLNILSARNHIWVVKNKKSMEIAGVITEHDVLSILAPKRLPSYSIGMPDIRSIHHGTAKTAADIMCCHGLVTCNKEDKIAVVLRNMTKHRLRRLPVVENKQLIGELTLNQLIRKYYDATQYHEITENKEG